MAEILQAEKCGCGLDMSAFWIYDKFRSSRVWAVGPPANYEKSGRRDPVPAAFGGIGFYPLRRTGKMPVPPRTFQGRTDSELFPPSSASTNFRFPIKIILERLQKIFPDSKAA
jgi:hypothetical protein